nr:hypothetical protein [Tanacetum cinerariifolium]
MESIHVNFDELPQHASVHNSTDPGPTRQEKASAHDSSDPGPTRQEMASVHNSTDPGLTRQEMASIMALEHGSLSPGRTCQENVSHGDKTGPLRGGFCLFCNSKAENSFTYNPNAYYFNDTSSNFNHLPQPQFETYLCELCGNDSHYGYDYQPHDDEEHYVQYKEYLKNSYNTIAASNFNQEKEQQRIVCIKVCEEQKKNIEDTMLELLEVCQQKVLYCMHNDVDDLIKKPEYSLSMRYEHLSTTPETESDEVIKSSVEKLVQILSECEVTSDNESECDVPVCEDSTTFDVLKDHSEILSDSNNDAISSDDDVFEDIEYVEASLLESEHVSLEEENDVYQEEEFNLEDIRQIQDVILREKLLSINRLIADIEFLNDNPTSDRVLKSSALFCIFEKFDNSLSYSDNSLPEFKIFSDHTEETRNGSTTSQANNSLPEYDSFCFEIEPDHGRLTSVVMKDISDNSTNDSLLEEVDLFLALDNSIPPGIENIDYDSEGDIHFLEELLSNDSIPLIENESSNFDYQDDPSFPRPPPEPPNVEFFFDFEPNSEEMISVVKNNIDELNEDECFDPEGGFAPQ